MTGPWESFQARPEARAPAASSGDGPWMGFAKARDPAAVEQPRSDLPDSGNARSKEASTEATPTSNPIAGMVDRGAKLASSFARGVANVAEPVGDWLETKVPLSGLTPDQVKNERQLQPLHDLADKLADTGIDYKPATTFQDVKDKPLSLATPRFIAEQAISSLPDMAAAVTAAPAYMLSLTEQSGEARARNDGRGGEPTLGDLAAAAPGAVVQGTLERFATARLPGTTAGATAATRIAKEAAVQAGTEAAENVAQNLSETVGTRQGVDAGELLDDAAAGALVGAGIGAGVRGTTEAARAVRPVASIAAAGDVPASSAMQIANPDRGDVATTISLEHPEASALREQAAQASTSGPLGRVASEVLSARADMLERTPPPAAEPGSLVDAGNGLPPALSPEAVPAGTAEAPGTGPWAQFQQQRDSQVIPAGLATELATHVGAPSDVDQGHLSSDGLALQGPLSSRERFEVPQVVDNAAGPAPGEPLLADTPVPLNSTSEATTGLALDRAQRLVGRFTKDWGPDAPRVVLARNADELRQAAGLPADAAVGDRAEGSWQGQPAVFINTAAIPTPKRLRQVLVHEALGHYGLDRVVGKDEWASIEQAINGHLRNNAGDKNVLAAIDQVRRSQPEALENPQTAAREVLAVMAENGVRGGLVDRLIAHTSGWLRRRNPELAMSTAALRDLLRQADGVLRRGATSRMTAPAATIAAVPPGHPAALFSRMAEPGPVEAPDVSQVAPEFPHLDDGQRAALGKIATFRAREGLAEKIGRITGRWKEKAIQGVFDQFAPLKDLDETAYQQARLSKGTDGAVEAAFRFGPPKLTDGALDVQRDGKGLQGVLQGLGGEHDLFMAWIAGNRSERLAAEGREHLFTPDEIASLKRVGIGKMADGRARPQVYADAQRALGRYNKAVLDVAEQAGLIDSDVRKTFESEWYVPFYRMMEGDKGVSPGMVKGLVRQQAIERLKGGGEPLGDLLENTLANWSHLLRASMSNMAAARALDAAVDLGIAMPAKAADKSTVWVMRNGAQIHYSVDDPLVFDALTMMHHPGWQNPAMRAMQWFKRALTTGVTADPAFRIRNLLRDTVSVIAANRVGYNPMRNLAQGWKASAPGSDTYLRLLGGGGSIRFGSMLDGQAANAKRLIVSGIAKESQILDTPQKAKAALGRAWTWWKEVGDRAETVNRAAIYDQARMAGKNHLEASYAARDALDFTMQGKWPAVRFLTQTVPFLNARLQGLHKLGRGAKADPRRFSVVTGAVAMASALLYLANRDDEEFRALPDWVRDTYWWVRLPGTDHAVFIPKPFEIGALGSVVERGTELATAGDDYQAKDFAGTLLSILSQQLSMNPVPQMFKPVTEAAFNWNSFQDRPIDSMGQERLPASDRYTARTSAGAIAAGKMTGISPQRIEHMVRGYFGWLGTQALAVSDLIGRGLFDMPSNPAHDYSRPENLAVVGAFIRPAVGSSSKYVTRYYRELDAVQQLYAAWSAARKAGEYERAAELYKEDRLKLRGLYTAADKHMRSINQRIRRVTANKNLSAEAKGELLAGLYATRDRLAKRTTERARKRQQVER